MTRRRATARLLASAAGTVLVCLVLIAIRRTVAIATGTAGPSHGLDPMAIVTTLFAGVVLMTQSAVWLGRLVDWCAETLTTPDEASPAWGEGSELLP